MDKIVDTIAELRKRERQGLCPIWGTDNRVMEEVLPNSQTGMQIVLQKWYDYLDKNVYSPVQIPDNEVDQRVSIKKAITDLVNIMLEVKK